MRRGPRFWLIAIVFGVTLFAIFKWVAQLGGILVGALFAQAVVIVILLVTARRYPPRNE